jgi:hypothetical protein
MGKAEREYWAWSRWVFLLGLGVVLLASGPLAASSQITYSRGQNIAPSFEGWMPNPDGTFEIFFGYFNRNFEEHLHIPIGPDNNVEPGGPDRGQPTYFFPRRNLNIFTVTVPADFGDNELVWTVTAHGKTEQAYASLIPEFILDQRIIFRQYTGFDIQGELEHNRVPTIRIEGERQRMASVGRPLALIAVAGDDGIPALKPADGGPFRGSAHGLRVAWFVYRGAGEVVSFDPAQFKVYPDFKSGSPWTRGWEPPSPSADGTYPVRVTFNEPGTFVLRALAHDGGAASSQNVTVTVKDAKQ